MLIEHYHKLCNTNDPSSIFVSPPPIPSIESLSLSTISSLDSGSFRRNQADVNIQQPTTSEVADTETVMDYNKDIDPPPPQDILNLFAVADLSSRSLSDSNKYIRTFAGECPDSCIRSLSIALNHKYIASIMAVNGAIFPKTI